MPPVAAKSKPKAPTVRELCQELLEIERDHPEIFARFGEIKTLLKAAADSQGKFREAFTGPGLVGWVSVSPSKPEETLGEGPEIIVDAWSKLKQPKRDKLIAEGLVKIVPLIKGASYGQVRTKLDTPTQGAAK
jgi:hypothetical protein